MKSCIVWLSLAFSCAAASENIINCYYGTWFAYRPGDGKFEPSHINPKLCTHLSYTFFGVDVDGSFKSLDPWLDLDSGRGFINKTVALKQLNPKLKVIAVVGGWNEGSIKYSDIAADASKRAKFISTALSFIQAHGFDGLDLDWEYPAQRGGTQKDIRNFVNLLQELKQALSPKGLLLSIAVAAAEASASQSYAITDVAKQVDYINVMTYDFSGSWDRVTGFNAPLVSSNGLNVEASINYWLKSGAPASKLVLGLAFYARTFTLANASETKPGSSINGPGTPGPFTREPGFLGYNEICTDTAWHTQWDSVATAPYAYKDNQWISYDHAKSIAAKIAFGMQNDLAGVMLWSIETDDFLGKCGSAYPLLTEINKALGKQVNIFDATLESAAASTSTKPEKQSPTEMLVKAEDKLRNDSEKCDDGRLHRDPKDCGRFYSCDGKRKFEFQCPANLKFDVSLQSCNWPDAVKC